MSIDTALLQRVIEGALLASGNPLTVQQLSNLFEEDERPGNEQIRSTLEDISNDYSDRGFELKQVSSGYRFQVIQDVAPWVSRLWDEKPQRYSRALLETLSLIAYRQPITRGDIEDIRGVSVSSHIIKTLLEREWVRVVGHKDVPGRPAMFATTRKFLDYFNMKSLEELPTLAEIKDLDSMNQELALEGADTPEPGTVDEGESAEEAETQLGADIDATEEVDEEPGLDGATTVDADNDMDAEAAEKVTEDAVLEADTAVEVEQEADAAVEAGAEVETDTETETKLLDEAPEKNDIPA